MVSKNLIEPAKILLLVVILCYVLLCPYTKVEESFNMQAMHDLLYVRHNISSYDHIEFPGVVPRTFIGSIVVSAIASPILLLCQFIYPVPKIWMQIVCRSILGCLAWIACCYFHDAVSIKFSKRTANLSMLLLATQFHLPFYMSRPLPNTFALICTLYANGLWISVRLTWI